MAASARYIINFLFYACIAFIFIGLIVLASPHEEGNKIIALGIFSITLFLLAKLIKILVQRKFTRIEGSLVVALLLTSVTIYTRYLYFTFWDYPGIVILPFFIVLSIAYIRDKAARNHKIVSLSIAYMILTIPLLGFPDLHKAPRQLIPKSWYNRFDIGGSYAVTIPSDFQSSTAADCYNNAIEIRKKKNYDDAISLLLACVENERHSAIYFELAYCYSFINELEIGIAMLDTAIAINPEVSSFYVNRGLIYYKLIQNEQAISDFEKAIELDPTKFIAYSNLALAQYYEKNFVESCKAITKAEQLGYPIKKGSFYEKVKRETCD